MLLFLPITTPRSKLLCRQVPASKVFLLVYNKIQNQFYFASKALTDVERLCCHWVGISWSGLDNREFHHFLYDSNFLFETDQKQPEAILSKNINQATPRLQRILIRTFAYHFTVKYIPGSTNQLVDCLSWCGGQKDTIKLPKLHVHQIINQLQARSNSLHELRIATQEDDELALLKHTLTHVWPSTIREVASKIQP